jgi:hypothetical protein
VQLGIFWGVERFQGRRREPCILCVSVCDVRRVGPRQENILKKGHSRDRRCELGGKRQFRPQASLDLNASQCPSMTRSVQSHATLHSDRRLDVHRISQRQERKFPGCGVVADDLQSHLQLPKRVGITKRQTQAENPPSRRKFQCF